MALLKQALGSASEDPEKEREILGQLATLYRKHGVELETETYHTLIRRYETLSAKGSSEAWSQLEMSRGSNRSCWTECPNSPRKATATASEHHGTLR